MTYGFPLGLRGTYKISDAKPEDKAAETLLGIKELLRKRAIAYRRTLLVHTIMRGSHWLILWWPADEPRHETGDEVFYASAGDYPRGTFDPS